MGKKGDIAMIVIFLTIIFGLGGATFILKDRKFSENENRYLAQSPDISMENIIDGSYMEDAEDYVSDQFVLRDMWMHAASEYRYILGMRDIGGVYIAKDHSFITKTEDRDIDEERLSKNIRYLNNFIKNTTSVSDENKTVIIVPTAAAVEQDRLPYFAPETDQDALMEDIRAGVDNARIIYAADTLRNMEGQAFYTTDHHWTSQGAYAVYLEYCYCTGRKPTKEYEFETVCSDLIGSLYSKVLLFDKNCDAIELPEVQDGYSILCDGVPGQLYCYDALNTKDKYNVFLGGNYGIVSIKGTGEGHLLVIKDSFANSFVPYLIDDYEEITMIDLRYYMGSVKSMAESDDITHILVLYNMANFVSDENIVKLGL